MMTDPTPPSKAELFRRIEAEWALLNEAVSQLSEMQMMTPDSGGWSPKDNLAHLFTWERWLVFYHLQGQPPEEVMGVDSATLADENAINAVILQRNQHRTVAEVLKDFRDTHALVLQALDQLTDTDLMRPRFEDDPRPLLAWIVGNTFEHYKEHGVNIKALAAQTRN